MRVRTKNYPISAASMYVNVNIQNNNSLDSNPCALMRRKNMRIYYQYYIVFQVYLFL